MEENVCWLAPKWFRMTRLSALMTCSALMSSMIKRWMLLHSPQNTSRSTGCKYLCFRSRATSCLAWIRRVSKSMSPLHLCTRWGRNVSDFNQNWISWFINFLRIFSSPEFVAVNTLIMIHQQEEQMPIPTLLSLPNVIDELNCLATDELIFSRFVVATP